MKIIHSITHWANYCMKRLTADESAPPILVYHSISDAADKHTVNAQLFEQHMGYFFKKGIKTISLSTYMELASNNKDIASNYIILTFDDGFADFYTTALPILKKYGFTATVFVTPGFVGSEKYMNWTRIWEIAASGIEIGSHTMTHPNLERCSAAELERELGESKHILEKETGEKVEFLAYPYGRFNETAREAAIKAGYKLALTTTEGVYNDNFTIGRTYITSTDSAAKIYNKMRLSTLVGM